MEKRTATIYNINTRNICGYYPIQKITDLEGNEFYCILVGEEGRSRKAYRIPLLGVDVEELNISESVEILIVEKDHYLTGDYLIDDKDQILFSYKRIENPMDTILILNLGNGYRGGSSYEVVEGDLDLVNFGKVAQGGTGGLGTSMVPVLLNTNNEPFVIRWERTGRTYSEEPIHYVIRKHHNGKVVVMPESTYLLAKSIESRGGAL